MSRRITSVQRRRWTAFTALLALLLQLASASLHRAALADDHAGSCAAAVVSAAVPVDLCGHDSDMEHHAAPHDAATCVVCQATQHSLTTLSPISELVERAAGTRHAWPSPDRAPSESSYVAPSAPRAPPACV